MSERDSRVIGYIQPGSLAALDLCRDDAHNGCTQIWMRPVSDEAIALVPLPLLAEAESRIVALQSRLNGVPEIISGLEMANAALIGSDHAHRDIQKAIDFLRSAALGGESRGGGEVRK